MQAGEVQLKLLLAGRAFTVMWTRAAADDCWDIVMRSDAHPERVRPVRRHATPWAAPAPERARAVEPAVKGERDRPDERQPMRRRRHDPHDERERDQRRDDAERSDGSGRSRLGGAGERGGGAGAERGRGTGSGGAGSEGGGGTGGAAAEADGADEPAPLRRRHLAPEPDETEQLGKDKVRWLLLRASLGSAADRAPGFWLHNSWPPTLLVLHSRLALDSRLAPHALRGAPTRRSDGRCSLRTRCGRRARCTTQSTAGTTGWRRGRHAECPTATPVTVRHPGWWRWWQGPYPCICVHMAGRAPVARTAVAVPARRATPGLHVACLGRGVGDARRSRRGAGDRRRSGRGAGTRSGCGGRPKALPCARARRQALQRGRGGPAPHGRGPPRQRRVGRDLAHRQLRGAAHECGPEGQMAQHDPGRGADAGRHAAASGRRRRRVTSACQEASLTLQPYDGSRDGRRAAAARRHPSHSRHSRHSGHRSRSLRRRRRRRRPLRRDGRGGA
jgi:uncharacterized membrane protein YgcG